MRDEKRLELLEKMMQEHPKALSLAVPTFTLEVLIKNCWKKEILEKQIGVEKAKADFYLKQLRQLEMQITGNLLTSHTKGRGRWEHANDVTGS